ncbi:trypsin-7-like [Schistocerca cancellata]|uniref:trypsin-7-like n=1 Tax=Schistocerca cancellata TaxID=274614 RepID=UPI002117C8A1|nr:trypsin-7-like [Schistocerca cancellata]
MAHAEVRRDARPPTARAAQHTSLTQMFSKSRGKTVRGCVQCGKPVDISEFPWQVSVEYVGAHRCGGSVVSAGWVMTNAWCVVGGEPMYYLLRVGTSTRGSGGDTYNASRLLWHEDFDNAISDKDIGFFEVSVAISFDDNVQPVALAEEEPAAGSQVTVSGWGSVDAGQGYPVQLHAANTTVLDRDACNATFEGQLITDDKICTAGPDGGLDYCNGDYGGPLVANGTQYGVVSWGYGCYFPQYPGVYTNVASLRSWINETVGV